jgi:hypothetical protein
VNNYPHVLSEAILLQLPTRIRELRARIKWVSPLAWDGYREYRDSEFLERVGLGGFAKDLTEFWPNMGPSWDALGVISDSIGRMKPGVILVEAKSHIAEIYGSGCQASLESLIKIEAALSHARSWCGVSTGENWLGPLYQSANRIAHLYFLYDRLRTPAWLVNLYFTGDPIGPADRPAWEHEVARVKTQLGVTRPVPNMVEVYLPALDDADADDPEESSAKPPMATPIKGKEKAARTRAANEYGSARRVLDLARR